MWTLILVLMTGDGVAIDHVDGFASRDACVAAAATVRVPEDRGREAYGWCVNKEFRPSQ